MRTCLILIAPALVASAAMAQIDLRKDNSGYVARAAAGNGSAQGPGGGNQDSGTWAALGPYGGDVKVVAASPTSALTVLAGLAPASGAAGAMYRSTDGGATWTIVASLSANSVYDVEFAPNGTAYAATTDGIWRSTNDGATWTSLPLGIGVNHQAFDVTLDPTNPQVIWAGIADALGGQPQNVIKSTDGGTNWTNATPPMGSAVNCQSIAISSANPNTVVAAFGGSFGGGAVWVTTDGGLNWTDRSAGLPGTPANSVVWDGSRFLVAGGQQFGSQNFGVFATSDLGASWTPLHDASWPTQVVNDLAIDPHSPSTILAATVAGVFKSTNGGASWQFGAGGSGSLSVNSVRFAPGSSTQIFAGAEAAGVYKSADAGASFAASSVGIGALDVWSVAANPNNNNELAIAFQGQNNGGVYRTTNGGQTWTLESAPGTRYNTVRFAPNGTLYAISDGPTGVAQEGLYRRNADGTWTNIGPDQGPLFESELYALRFSQNNPNLIFTGGADFGVAGWKGTVWRSDNAGSTWTKVYLGPDDFKPVMDIEISEDGTDQLMLASVQSNSGDRIGTVLRSTNGGQSWAPSSSGLPATFQGSSLATSPSSPQTFFVSNFNGTTAPTGGGLFKTTDGGQTWASTGYAPSVRVVESDPADASTLYICNPATGTGERAYRSQDGGASFALFSDGLPTNEGTGRWLFYAPGATPKLLLATTTGTFANVLGGAACYANCDGSTTPPILNVNDFTCFLNKYAAGDSYANCDGSTTPPVLNVNDFTCFLNKYAVGCP